MSENGISDAKTEGKDERPKSMDPPAIMERAMIEARRLVSKEKRVGLGFWLM